MRDHRAEVSLNISPDEDYEPRPVEPREFRILIVGDFGGRGDDAGPSGDSPRRVDRDDLDAYLARIAPRLHVDVAGTEHHLAFASLDDFHPDQLAARLAALDTRVPSVQTSAPAAKTPTSSPPIGSSVVSGASLLDDILDDAAGPAAGESASTEASRSRGRGDDLSAFIDRAVEPHLVRRDAGAEANAEVRQREMSATLRAVLHHPRVQALEATWRSLDLLVRRLDTDGDLRLFLLDRPRAHVATALEQLGRSHDAADDERWALVAVLHAFPDGDSGAQSLAALAMAATSLGAPCVAAAPASFTGADSLARLGDDERSPSPAPDVYELIRGSADGRFLGLTYPRVLMRAPYGRDNPCDTIDFEELDDPDRHTDYLWGSGAALVALIVGEAFTRNGWAIGGRFAPDVAGLPYFTYRRDGQTIAKSCAEGIMSERVARWLLGRGIMPVAWIRDTDRVRIVDLRSVTDPSSPLSAAWAGPAPRRTT